MKRRSSPSMIGRCSVGVWTNSRAARWKYTREVMAANAALAADIVAVIDELGPSMPRDIEAALGIVRDKRRRRKLVERGEVKHVCEALFAEGGCRRCGTRSSPLCDRSERIVGTDIAETRIDRADAQRILVGRAAASLGVGTSPTSPTTTA